MLKSILFPVIKKPITLKQTITGIAKINAIFLAYCLTITAIALIFKNPSSTATSIYDSPIIAWAKIPITHFHYLGCLDHLQIPKN